MLGRDNTLQDFLAGEAAAGEVAINLGADLARELWASADPIGRRLQTTVDTDGGPQRPRPVSAGPHAAVSAIRNVGYETDLSGAFQGGNESIAHVSA